MLLKLLKQNCKNFYLKVLVIAIFAAISSTGVVMTPFLIGEIVNILKAGGNFAEIERLLLWMLTFVLFSFVFGYFVQLLSGKLALQICTNLRKLCIKRFNFARVSDLSKQSLGNLQAVAINDIEKLYEGMSAIFNLVFSSTLSIASMLVMVAILNAYALILMFFMLPLAFAISKFISKNSAKHFFAEAQDSGDLNGLTEEFLTNQRTAKFLCAEDVMGQKFEKINSRLLVSGRNAQWFSSLTQPSTRLVNNFVYILLGFLGGLLCLGSLSVGALIAFLGYATSFAQPINNFTAVTAQIGTSSAALLRVENLLKLEEENVNKIQKPLRADDKAVVSQNICGQKSACGTLHIENIEFDNIKFAYSKNKVIFDGFSLKVKRGLKVAIVGKTGSGKTTLVNLLLRFFDLDGGQILIDGKSIEEIPLHSLRSAFSMVLQETWLFSGTIRENICFANDHATKKELEHVLELTTLDKHLKKFPQGLDTIVSENDSLSQGQRQLVTVARAMLSPADNLILDEATSNVDIETEQQISKNFMEMMEGKTTFIIAHRLETIKNCDVVIKIG